MVPSLMREKPAVQTIILIKEKALSTRVLDGDNLVHPGVRFALFYILTSTHQGHSVQHILPRISSLKLHAP